MEEPRLMMALLFGGASLLITVLAIPLALGKIGPNPIYGVRFPSTLENPRVWYEVNQKLGREGVVMGGINFAVCVVLFFVPALNSIAYALVGAAMLLVTAIAALVRSLVVTSRSKRGVL